MTLATRLDSTPGSLPFPTVDKQAFRNGMARLAAAVNIITSRGPEGWCGFTASAVTSVTDSPATLLVCINRGTQSYLPIVNSGLLCVNTTAAVHEDLAMRFSGGVKDMAARFEGAVWIEGETRVPRLADAAVAFECRLTQVVAVGSHDVLICEVVAVHEGEEDSSLVYVGRKFRSL
ncbi:flavin reductase family protein [Methyloraptor flagellatus]|uniref:Flavin reductase family protein n=1 Tax=Methyloraptor flagellatus TaxID=3162530 RepID=A0AAU7X8C6_9HYPH